MEAMKIFSPAFADNGQIPSRYTCDGEDINPPLHLEHIPQGTKSLALIIEDPDAPSGLWIHWMVWNINSHQTEIAENSTPKEAMVGRNNFERTSYGGPCPPSGTHRYIFRLFALDKVLALAGGSTKKQLEEAMKPHVLANAQLTGLYGRA
jgi:Raf kinase inhibitor-like YbhB/YbcL family protein